MFVSHEKNVHKKIFQKPNILRRSSKIVMRPDLSKTTVETNSEVTSTNVNEANITDQFEIKPIHEKVNRSPITKSILKLTIANNNVKKENYDKPQETNIDAIINKNASGSSNIIQITNTNKNIEQNSLNIESFINSGTLEENLPNIDFTENKTVQAETKWCFDLTNNATDIIINNYNVPQLTTGEVQSDYNNDIVVPSEVPLLVQQPSKQLNEIICASGTTRSVSVELFSNRAVKFKCDEPNCNKGFWTAERLAKHKSSHNRPSSVRAPSQVLIECPVKKTLEDGVEEKCPRTFQLRRELLKHLNADHTPDDALHRCSVCGRRFFWASGLRAHAQSVCARGGLACAWPGCSRVFALPCRLREHARAHTGDRPYLCKYPECGWAFRSASKLVRHARRHTDERRHVCGACGRAFLRREHLRDHAARHHAAHTRAQHVCTHAGCEQSFTNMSTLYMHMKKVHRKQETDNVTATVTDQVQETSVVDTTENIYLPAGSVSQHAARTHVPWPLARRHEPAYVLDVLEDDATIENAECSVSNVYTVRSDLFLHGNIPIDDDSQNIGGAEIVEDSEVVTPLDTDLCLIDSHPTIDLMQEELMYDDAAVDESSFRVFLMNGEELS